MMTRRRNLLPLAGFLVCAIALVSYPTFFAGFEATRDVAWAWLLFALLKRLSASAEAPRLRRWEEHRFASATVHRVLATPRAGDRQPIAPEHRAPDAPALAQLGQEGIVKEVVPAGRHLERAVELARVIGASPLAFQGR